jgi:flavorubredoxin
MEQIRGLSFKSKGAAAFCSYGWSGEARPIIENLLGTAGFNKLPEGPKVLWYPGAEQLESCFEYGQMIATHIA